MSPGTDAMQPIPTMTWTTRGLPNHGFLTDTTVSVCPLEWQNAEMRSTLSVCPRGVKGPTKHPQLRRSQSQKSAAAVNSAPRRTLAIESSTSKSLPTMHGQRVHRTHHDDVGVGEAALVRR